MRKRQRANRIVWIAGIFIVCGILAASAVIGNRLGDAIRGIRPARTRIRDAICEYVLDNRERIISEMAMMQSWKEQFVSIYEMDGKILGVMNNLLYPRTEVRDEEIMGFVNGKNITDLSYPIGSNTDIEINFEKDGVVSVKACSAGNVTYAAYHGYYYSPGDVPLWVCAEAPKSYSDRTGEYLHYPLKQDGEMWKADIDAIEKAVHESFIDDYCTMRICENLYYYCYGW